MDNLDFSPLLSWYRSSARDLPWRRQVSPYEVLVSEFMLQQTRVEVVVPYYHRFLERFPSLQSLASADPEDVLALWSGLGYYRRARSLQLAARAIASLGRFPDSEPELQALPGIGPYTSAALASIAFDKPAVALDGNAVRVLSRVLGYRGRSHSHLRSGILPRIPAQEAAAFTQAVMELGATLCRPRAPLCELCALSPQCLAHRHGLTDEIPPKATARPSVSLELQALRLRSQGRFLLERQTAGPLLKGMWMVPYRSADEGGVDSLLEGLGLETGGLEKVGIVRHQITFRRITVDVFAAEVRDTNQRVCEAGPSESLRWVDDGRLGELGLPSLARKILTVGVAGTV